MSTLKILTAAFRGLNNEQLARLVAHKGPILCGRLEASQYYRIDGHT